MYGWIWQRLPGPLGVRLLVAALLIAGILTLLLGVVFPRIEPHLPWNDVDVEQGP